MTRNHHQINAIKTVLVSSACALLPLSALADSQKINSSGINPSSLKSTSKNVVSTANLKIAKSIYEIMKHYQLTHDIDKHSVNDKSSPIASQNTVGQEALIEQIAQFVSQDNSIPMAMIGFPFKSNNVEQKVIGDKPDMAERYALSYINSMLIKIRAVYPQGATFQIISDGCTFNDIVGIRDDVVRAYEDTLKILASDFKDIHIITSRELGTSASGSMNDLRRDIESYPPTSQEFEKMIVNNPSVFDELDVIKKRLSFDFDHEKGKQILNRIAAQESTMDPLLSVSKRIIIRSRQFGKFISSTFLTSPCLRFSVHFQKDLGKKFGMKLSDSSTITPWHGVLLQKGKTFQIVHKSDLPLKKVVQTGETINGILCPYYKFK